MIHTPLNGWIKRWDLTILNDLHDTMGNQFLFMQMINQCEGILDCHYNQQFSDAILKLFVTSYDPNIVLTKVAKPFDWNKQSFFYQRPIMQS